MTVGDGHHMLFFILGAPDPEMQAIEALLRACGQAYGYAVIGGERVHPGNAYRATAVLPPCTIDQHQAIGDVWMLDEYRVVVVECAVAGLTPWQVCDHHRPGDAGYGRPPEEFLPASSIGQVIVHLGRLGVLPEWPAYGSNAAGNNWAFPGQVGHDHYGRWWVADSGRPITLRGRTRSESPDGMRIRSESYAMEKPSARRVPDEYVMMAAADHCLGAAYWGECPGVDPDALMRWRIEQRAAFQGRSVESVLADVNAARQEVRRREVNGVADFGSTTIPELPEAACREGIAFIATVTERDGRRKRVLQAATPAQVQDWMAGEGATLAGLYGDPARGFAGGYLPPD